MRRWVKYKVSLKYLVVALLIATIGLFLTKITIVKKPTDYYQLQYRAAQIMSQAIEAISKERKVRQIPINKQLDPNGTGLIGEEYNELTTTLGNLDAKRTSTNPDFAALMVKYFQQAGLKSGDVIAIGSSGSFPALLLATLSASKVMGIIPLTIYAIGASEYGANIPDFTFIDMLKVLNERNILDYKLAAVSMGGNQDQAKGLFFPESKKTIMDIAKRSGVYLIDTGELATNIQKRLDIYRKEAGGKQIKLFVNIGGASANFGDTNQSLNLPNGLVFQVSETPASTARGLVFEFLELKIPIIHLLNIRDLSIKNGIPIDPIPLPGIGQSEVFFKYNYQKWIIILTILSAAGVLIKFKNKNNYELK
ncbi:MAG: poly-gamma-glutamate system protein [Candidatus Atribacteria bacterium]|nr:poly-gamma-glutamate system protein [Candidatus Atribacteria bacterium]